MYLCMYVSIYPIYLHIYLSIYLSTHLSIYLHINLSIDLSIYLSIYTFIYLTARNLYQLNANEIPLTLHYGFEGRFIILHKNPYRWRLQNEAETVGNYLKMTLMLIKKVL